MHKLKKGLKKKIKGKDHKDKGEDLFDPEQLAKFKKELEARKELEEQGEANTDFETKEAHSSKAVTADQGDEEWRSFNLLTSGVDSILNKASGDLDRIKSSSYFQRAKPEVKPAPQRPKAPTDFQHNRWVDCDNTVSGLERGEREQLQEAETFLEEIVPEKSTEEPKQELPKEEEGPEEEPIVLPDELFDTSFLDAIASGEIKLAFIPDSPTEPEGDDPFDTSSADAIVKVIEEQAKKEKKRVNLGVAVEVLTGGKTEAEEKSNAISKAKKTRYRPQNINLLGSFDEGGVQQSFPVSEQNPESVTHDVFDELCTDQLLLNSQNATELIQPVHLDPSARPEQKTEKPQPAQNLTDLLKEFEVLGETDLIDSNLILPEDEDTFLEDEFAGLAAESLHKGDSVVVKPTPPKRPVPPTKKEEEPQEPDPFDTSYIEVECPDTKFPQSEDHITFDESEDQVVPHKVNPSLTEASDPDVEYADPFDTSTLKNIEPGKFELKLLEEEFLPSGPVTQELELQEEVDDFDFDPRKGEIPAPVPHPLDEIKESECAHAAVKPLTPATESLSPVELDPFDTSAVNITQAALPGKLELQILEKEFGHQPNPENSHTDIEFDFDPRHGEPELTFTPVQEKTVTDIFDSESEIGAGKVLIPSTGVEEKFSVSVTQPEHSDADPFDTSCVEDVYFGKTELKSLEAELLHSTTDVQPPARPPLPINLSHCSVKPVIPSVSAEPEEKKFEFDSHDDHSARDQITPLKPIAPLDPLFGSLCEDSSSSFSDPFDTTIANSVIPGKFEIQLLESELGVQAGACTHSDDDFNPREALHPSDRLTNCTLVPTLERKIQPEQSEVDPFDTSAADSLILGKGEIKLLEAELL